MIIQQFLRFAGVGVIGTTGHYAVLIILVELFDYNPVFGSFLGFLTGALINYFLNRRYTFASNSRHAVALPKFILVAVVGMIINIMVMSALVETFDLQYLLAQVVATALVLIWNFSVNKYWTFASYS